MLRLCVFALVVALALAAQGVSSTTLPSSLSFLAGPQTKLLYPETVASSLSRNTSQRVAIVGAGAAGLTAAATLQQLGYKNVVLFESSPKVGGKCFTVEVDGEFYDLGAIEVSDAYPLVTSLAAATRTPFSRFGRVPKNENSGSNSSQALDAAGAAELLSGAAALAGATARHSRAVKAPSMLQASSDPALAAVTFSEFASENRLGATVTQLLTDAMTGFGYSYATLTSAAFWMRLVPDLAFVSGPLGTLMPSFKRYGLGALTFDNGFQSLWENVAKEISNPGSGGKTSPVQVRTGTSVVGVTRGTAASGGIQVSYAPSSAPAAPVVTTASFDRIIVTAPLQTAQSFMQLTPQESALFSQIKTVRYLVTLAEPPAGYASPTGGLGNPAYITQNTVPSRVNHVVAFAEQRREFGPSQRSLRTFYQILDDSITTAAATDILRQDALELSGVPLGEIKAQKNWERDAAYFPHLTSESMASGWYKDVEASQGQQGTFWAGSIMSFEDVERTSVYANYLALRWF